MNIKIVVAACLANLIFAGSASGLDAVVQPIMLEEPKPKSAGQKVMLGALEIMRPMLRATPPNAPVGGGYMMIRNTGDVADYLLGGSTDFAARVEVHEMQMSGSVMKMRKLEHGLEIPAGSEVVLETGGYHLMLMKLKSQLKKGEKRKITLEFKKAGKVAVVFMVEDLMGLRRAFDDASN